MMSLITRELTVIEHVLGVVGDLEMTAETWSVQHCSRAYPADDVEKALRFNERDGLIERVRIWIVPMLSDGTRRPDSEGRWATRWWLTHDGAMVYVTMRAWGVETLRAMTEGAHCRWPRVLHQGRQVIVPGI